MELRDRLSEFIRALPLAHRVVIVAATAAVVMGGVFFARWITEPSWTVLYANLDDQTVANTIDELETAGVPYKLEGGGSRILVPRDRLYHTRANLAAAGVSGRPTPKGYELLDNQGLSVSDFRQRVDYRRALEGELARTLSAMGSVNNATVHLVIPERELFVQEDRRAQVTASVLLDTRRPLAVDEIDTVTFLVSSAVEGLEANQVTVADVNGTVLHAPGDSAGPAGITSRQLRHTREFELALAGDITNLLERITGDKRTAVVVRAVLDFDERTIEAERFGPGEGLLRSEQTTEERYTGTGLVRPGGVVGADGGPLAVDGGATEYERDEAAREFGVDRVLDRTVAAPGEIRKLSVAIVMDDGSLTGVAVPPIVEVEGLVQAALGLDEARGDSLAVSTVPFPTTELAPDAGGPSLLADLLPRVIGVLVLLLVSVALFLMTRGRRRESDEPVWGRVELAAGSAPPLQAEPVQLAPAEPDADATLRQDVNELVQRQPEEIAALLRGWLVDRR